MSLILKIALKYLESHPDQVMSLVDAGISALGAWLHKLAAEHKENTPAPKSE